MRASRQENAKKGKTQLNFDREETSIRNYILLTKLRRPPVAPDIYPRPRLLDQLKDWQYRPLTLISAPAGYGKSTFASQWVTMCGYMNGWVSLDEGDNDLRTFLSYVLAAIRSMFPKMELKAEGFLEVNQYASGSVLARHLANDLHHISDPFIMVLDDYHRIKESPVHDFIKEILSFPPPSMHLALLTRSDPPLQIARLRGRSQVAEIRCADLRFTVEEAAGFLRNMIGDQVDDATAELLENKTEGWATGLRLVGIYLRNRDDVQKEVEKISGISVHIAGYLVEEVLSNQDPEITSYLLETSILERFCAPLCQAVHSGGIERQNNQQAIDAQRFIEWLVESNLFIISLDDEGLWYRYHHMFQDLLQALLRKQTNPKTIAGLHARAGDWFADKGLIEEAIRHKLAADDAEAAVRLVLDHRYGLMDMSRFARLNRWIELLPQDAVAATTLLLTAKAFIGLVLGPSSDAFTYTELAHRNAEALPKTSPDASILNGEIAILQSAIDIIRGQNANLFTNAQNALKWLPKHALYLRSLATSIMAVSCQMDGNYNRGVALIKEALADQHWSDSIQGRMWAYLSIMGIMEADSSGVILSAHECMKFSELLQLIHLKNNAQCYLGIVHYLRNELEEAKIYLDNVMRNRDVAKGGYLAQAAGMLAFIHFVEGRPAESDCIMTLIATDTLLRQDGYSQAIMGSLAVELALRQGQLNEAKRLSLGVDFDKFPPSYFHIVPQLTRVKLLMAQGTVQHLREAHARLTQMDEQMARINRKNIRIDILAQLALVNHKLGQESEALKILQAALDLAEPGGWVRNFMNLGAPMADLLERLVQVRPDHTYGPLVLKAFNAEGQQLLRANADTTCCSQGQVSDSILTQREIELLPMLAEGLKNKEIAARLYISPVTVKTHLQNIYKKLNVKGRVGALRKARNLGLIPGD